MRFLPLVPLDGVVYSPNRILEEVQKGTPLGERLQQKLETRSFSQDELEKVAEKRLEWIFTHLPKSVGLASFTLGEQGYTPEELIKLVKERKGVGKKLLEDEVRNIKKLMGERS